MQINYIKILNRQIEITYQQQNKKVINVTIKKYLDQILLEQLTTYQGRKDAIRMKYHYHKLIPIYINKSLCLIPLFNQRDYRNIYINIYKIKTILKNSVIIFDDNTWLMVDKKRSILEKQITNAYKINI